MPPKRKRRNTSNQINESASTLDLNHNNQTNKRTKYYGEQNEGNLIQKKTQLLEKIIKMKIQETKLVSEKRNIFNKLYKICQKPQINNYEIKQADSIRYFRPNLQLGCQNDKVQFQQDLISVILLTNPMCFSEYSENSSVQEENQRQNAKQFDKKPSQIQQQKEVIKQAAKQQNLDQYSIFKQVETQLELFQLQKQTNNF